MRQGFVIEIYNQEYSSWQGKVKWINENKTQHFRSAIELIHLIDSAMNNNTLRDWKKTAKKE